MAGLAFGVIACRLPLRTLVRVVAGQATDPRIVLVETLTEGQAVRLKSNILDTLQVHQFHLHPRAVAGAAKVRQVSRIQLAWIENVGRTGIPGLDGGDVLGARTVARLAGDARSHALNFEAGAADGAGRVTAKAGLLVGCVHHPARGFVE